MITETETRYCDRCGAHETLAARGRHVSTSPRVVLGHVALSVLPGGGAELHKLERRWDLCAACVETIAAAIDGRELGGQP